MLSDEMSGSEFKKSHQVCSWQSSVAVRRWHKEFVRRESIRLHVQACLVSTELKFLDDNDRKALLRSLCVSPWSASGQDIHRTDLMYVALLCTHGKNTVPVTGDTTTVSVYRDVIRELIYGASDIQLKRIVRYVSLRETLNGDLQTRPARVWPKHIRARRHITKLGSTSDSVTSDSVTSDSVHTRHAEEKTKSVGSVVFASKRNDTLSGGNTNVFFGTQKGFVSVSRNWELLPQTLVQILLHCGLDPGLISCVCRQWHRSSTLSKWPVQFVSQLCGNWRDVSELNAGGNGAANISDEDSVGSERKSKPKQKVTVKEARRSVRASTICELVAFRFALHFRHIHELRLSTETAYFDADNLLDLQNATPNISSLMPLLANMTGLRLLHCALWLRSSMPGDDAYLQRLEALTDLKELDLVLRYSAVTMTTRDSCHLVIPDMPELETLSVRFCERVAPRERSRAPTIEIQCRSLQSLSLVGGEERSGRCAIRPEMEWASAQYLKTLGARSTKSRYRRGHTASRFFSASLGTARLGTAVTVTAVRQLGHIKKEGFIVRTNNGSNNELLFFGNENNRTDSSCTGITSIVQRHVRGCWTNRVSIAPSTRLAAINNRQSFYSHGTSVYVGHQYARSQIDVTAHPPFGHGHRRRSHPSRGHTLHERQARSSQYHQNPGGQRRARLFPQRLKQFCALRLASRYPRRQHTSSRLTIEENLFFFSFFFFFNAYTPMRSDCSANARCFFFLRLAAQRRQYGF
jgi:hypothetical protein